MVSACAGRCSASACSSRPPLLPQPHEKRWPCLRSCLSPGRLSHTWGTASGSRPEPEGRCPGPASLLCIPSDVALMGVVAGCSRGSVVSPGSFQTSVKTSTEFACGEVGVTGAELPGEGGMCLRFLQCRTVASFPVRRSPGAGALTALSEAGVWVHLVDSLIHVVADASFPDRKGLRLREEPRAGLGHLSAGKLAASAFEPGAAVTAVGIHAGHAGASVLTGVF